jgi:uncharacterized protein YbjT (DUF2867 family)
MLLITGATGGVGSLVTERLLARGERPRILTRDESKARRVFGDRVDVAVGELDDQRSLAAAMRGVSRVFLVAADPGPHLVERDATAARVARASGVERVVKLSTFDAAHRVGTGVWHERGEAAIRTSGVGFAFVRPSGFMSNALAWAPAIRAAGTVASSTGDGKIAFIHPRDIADVATAVLLSPDHAGATLRITGPVALSYGEMVAKIGAAIGCALVFRAIDEANERTRWRARGETEETIDYHISIFRAIRTGRLAEVTDTVEHMLGRPASSFDRWVEEHAGEFR